MYSLNLKDIYSWIWYDISGYEVLVMNWPTTRVKCFLHTSDKINSSQRSETQILPHTVDHTLSLSAVQWTNLFILELNQLSKLMYFPMTKIFLLSITYLDWCSADSPVTLILNLRARPHFLHDRSGPRFLPRNPQQYDRACECFRSGRNNHAGELPPLLRTRWLSRVG